MSASASDMLEFIGGSGYLARYMTAASGFNGLRGPRRVNLDFGFCEVCRSLACGPQYSRRFGRNLGVILPMKPSQAHNSDHFVLVKRLCQHIIGSQIQGFRPQMLV